MKTINEENIERILLEGENNHYEFKTSFSPFLSSLVVAFLNTNGGAIIFGYDESTIVGIDDSLERKVRVALNDYLPFCEIYTVSCQNKKLLIVETCRSGMELCIGEKYYYRDGEYVKSFRKADCDSVLKVIKESSRSLSLNDLSYLLEMNREQIRSILDSPLCCSVLKRKISGELLYACNEALLFDSKPISNLSEVSTIDELISYLENRVRNIDKTTMLHQYTTIGAAKAIISRSEFYIGSPENMNDILEYNHFSREKWQNIFFSCFMENDNESIAMWSQYAQPWSQGVRLSIPIIYLKAWLKDLKTIYPADPKTKDRTNDYSAIALHRFKKSLHMVAYTNEDDLKSYYGPAEINVGKASQKNITGLYDNDSMCGYVKNSAWSYEKEIRFRFEIDKRLCISNNAVKGIIIPISDEVLKSIEIMKGPRMETSSGEWTSLIEIMNEKGLKPPRESIFAGKLQNMACDRCKLKS